ncbi:MAG TPA: kelch repeat-containing protein [Acidimicrobiales bacterium]|nr:kelch repeat-containing protein [Acidimicrobiales bacterium]
MRTGRLSHTSTTLADGRVLVVGGQDSAGVGITTAEVYDPESGNWSAAGSLATARLSHSATLLGDGRVLVAGGAPSEQNRSQALDTFETWSPVTGLWSPAGRLGTSRGGHTATLLRDGRVLLSGGLSFAGTGAVSIPSQAHPLAIAVRPQAASALASVEIYDPRAEQSKPTASMSAGRTAHSATALDDGTVLVADGSGGGPAGLASAERYDPVAGSWSPTHSLVEARSGHTATLLEDGTVLVAGSGPTYPGEPAPGPAASSEVYDPSSGRWRRTAHLAVPRAGHTATLLTDGTVLVAGGYRADAAPSVTPAEPSETYLPRAPS